MSTKIEKQGIEGRSGYCANGSMIVISPMSNTRSKLGSEGKCLDCSNVSKTIENQGIKGSLEYCAKGKIKVSSPMSKTSSKQDIEVKWGDCSSASKKTFKSKTLKELWDMAPMGK